MESGKKGPGRRWESDNGSLPILIGSVRECRNDIGGLWKAGFDWLAGKVHNHITEWYTLGVLCAAIEPMRGGRDSSNTGTGVGCKIWANELFFWGQLQGKAAFRGVFGAGRAMRGTHDGCVKLRLQHGSSRIDLWTAPTIHFHRQPGGGPAFWRRKNSPKCTFFPAALRAAPMIDLMEPVKTIHGPPRKSIFAGGPAGAATGWELPDWEEKRLPICVSSTTQWWLPRWKSPPSWGPVRLERCHETVGGADRMVCVWDVESARVPYKLPGHKGTVTSVDFHPKEPILLTRVYLVLTGSKDGAMLLGELEPGVGV
ncbi:hypothetical protein DFH06DRAFT_1145815 [Mycena polygramma]|nr:hypothetical protein DFH06DRAFT_1145815 [Mycena polygramma]